MTLEEGWYAHLAADSGVAALVSTRIYPLVMPQDVDLPAIAYQKISGPRDHVHEGPSGLVTARMQVTCLGSSYSAAKGLSEAVRVAVDGFSGTMGTVTVNAALLVNEVDSWADGFEAPVVRLDFMVWYQE